MGSKKKEVADTVEPTETQDELIVEDNLAPEEVAEEQDSVGTTEGESEDSFTNEFAEQLKAEKEEKLKKQAEKKAERDAAKNQESPRTKVAEALVS